MRRIKVLCILVGFMVTIVCDFPILRYKVVCMHLVLNKC
jgi:hypothetical protein